MVDVGPADRAAVGHPEAALLPVRSASTGPDHARDHVAGARDQHRVADANVVVLDVGGVVQRGALDGDAADLHGLEHRVGIERSGAADADDDVDELRARLARLELESDRPARVARDDAKPLLQCEIVDFYHDAVDLVVELVASLLPFLQNAMTSSNECARAMFGLTGKPSARRRRSDSHCVAERVLGDELIGEKRKPPLRGQRGIELAHAARRGVARIGEGRQPVAFARGVEPLEIALAKIDLAAHLDERGVFAPWRASAAESS